MGGGVRAASDDGSSSSSSGMSGVGTPMAGKSSAKSIATSGDNNMGGGREGEILTANDTTMTRSHRIIHWRRYPLSRNRWKVDYIIWKILYDSV